MDLYKGKTLLESLDGLKPLKRLFNDSLKISIFNFERIPGIGIVFEGKILSGQLNISTQLLIPINKIDILNRKIPSIEIYNNIIDNAVSGDIIGFYIGTIIYYEAKLCELAFAQNQIDCVKDADNLRVKILKINKKVTLRIDSDLTLFSYTLNVPIKIKKIEYIIDKSNKILQKKPKEMKNVDFAFIIIELKKSYYFEKYSENPFLGSFELFYDDLVAVGYIKDINI